MQRWVLLICLLWVFTMLPCLPASAEEADLVITPEIGIYSIEDETIILHTGQTFYDLSQLGSGEYAAFVFHLRNDSAQNIELKSVYARIDQGQELRWGDFTLNRGKGTYCHIFYVNMQKVKPGTHRVDFYANGRLLKTAYLILDQGSSPIPASPDPAGYTASKRSPYLVCAPVFPGVSGFTEYAVDFRVSLQPRGTYLCLCNFDMDMSELRKHYDAVYRDYSGVAGYGGFQVLDDGTKLAIMSIWYTYCEDASGNVTKITPKVVYPASPLKYQEFGGEGQGMQCMVRYEWQANTPYRVLFQQSVSEETGNCLLSMWVCDLSTMAWQKLIEYDMGCQNTWMNRAVTFLENYVISTASEYRDVRLSNFRVRNRDTGEWVSAYSAKMHQSYDHPGSYTYGSDDDSFYCFTTAMPDIWPVPQQNATFSVNRCETGKPY